MKCRIHNHAQWLWGLLGAIPLGIELPHMFNAWRNSPLDAIDWAFLLLALIAGIAVILTSDYDHAHQLAKKPLVGAILCIVGFFSISFTHSIHALAIVLAIGFWWCILWLLLDWANTFWLIPPFAILLLGTTSSTYWLCVFLGLSPHQIWAIKLFFALCLCILEAFIIYYRAQCSQMNTLFAIAMLGALLLLGQTRHLNRTYPPLLLAPKNTIANLIGREPTPDDNFKRFFHTSDAHTYEYASHTNLYNLLAVSCGNDIHEIHPASHCLRSSGWKISREELLEITIKGRHFSVTEVEASRHGTDFLVWVWYSTNELSTGNFLTFRRDWDDNTYWETYQLAVQQQGDTTASRQALADFLEACPEQ